MAPIIPRTPAVRDGNAGGWNGIHLPRILGLVALNIVGVHGFVGLPIIAFTSPLSHGTEPRRSPIRGGSMSPIILATTMRQSTRCAVPAI